MSDGDLCNLHFSLPSLCHEILTGKFDCEIYSCFNITSVLGVQPEKQFYGLCYVVRKIMTPDR